MLSRSLGRLSEQTGCVPLTGEFVGRRGRVTVATTDFAQLVNHFPPARAAAGSEARQPRPSGGSGRGR